MDRISSLESLDLKERRVFLRVDLNVPLTGDGKVADDSRILAVLPTVNHLLARQARIVLASHLGRPKGRVVPSLSLEPVAARLAELLNHEVQLADRPVGDAARKLSQDLLPGEILLLENLRYDPGEKANDEDFARELASYAEVYVNDAFGAVHRQHASVTGVVRHFDQRGMGLLMMKELTALGRLLEDPADPFVALLGGAKVSDKIGLIRNLLRRCESILIGGAMAYTFLKARGEEVGGSRVEEGKLETAEAILTEAGRARVTVVLPSDHVVAREISEDAETRTVEQGGIGDDEKGLDIGPETIKTFSRIISQAGKAFWNGPMGVFEMSPFQEGTRAVGAAMAGCPGYTVAGGGDSAAAARRFGLAKRFDHVSTGGGASLKFLEGRDLPGLVALMENQSGAR